MTPKKAVIILLIIIILGIIFFAWLYFRLMPEAGPQDSETSEQTETTEKIDLKNKAQEELKKKQQTLQQKFESGEMKTRELTDDEIDFILSPQRNIMKELGIEGESENKQENPLTKEEVDAILNPSEN